MPMIYDTIEVTFDAAHMLSGYEGLCANLHGHTYKLQIQIGAPYATLTDKQKVGTSEEGMLMDFKELKKIIQENEFMHLVALQ